MYVLFVPCLNFFFPFILYLYPSLLLFLNKIFFFLSRRDGAGWEGNRSGSRSRSGGEFGISLIPMPSHIPLTNIEKEIFSCVFVVSFI